MEQKQWWQGPMRVMQYNLQVRDTGGMDAEKIARETEELACNVVVVNVGGIYAWYPSKVKYHHINEFLPKDRDLLTDLIEAFHRRNIKFVARFDFSITDDTTYLEKPQWFARHKDKTPYFRGEKRMGDWSLFLNTCANSGYRNEEVAVPVLKEVLNSYDIDGIFLNAPMASACFCEKCQEKYEQTYRKPMPDSELEFEEGWLSKCTKDNIGEMYRAIKATRDVPLILYYTPYSGRSKSFGRIDRDSIYERYETADLICTESQDVLSRGVNDIPETIHPIMAMKAGQREDGTPKPFGIIHSCPGMDWRHVGLPVAEYLPWMCQVPASGGILWHSVTGYPDTIPDKRILKAAGKVDRMILKSEPDMEGAKSRAEVLLCWDGSQAARGWAEALVKNHVSFDLMQDYRINEARMSHYRAVVAPDGLLGCEGMEEALETYVKQGGRLLLENTSYEDTVRACGFIGISPQIRTGEYLTASYLYFEEAGGLLKKGMETDKIPFRGAVTYCTPDSGCDVLATLIPPFAPLEVVGAPPERASIPVQHTEIPLVMNHQWGEGQVVYLPFSLNSLLQDYRLSDHYQFIGNLVDFLLGERELSVDGPGALQTTMYETEDKLLIHLVNETGQRPLMDTVPVHNVVLRVKIPEGRRAAAVRSVIEEQKLEWRQEEDRVVINLERVEVWEMIAVDLASEK